jgi:hypothetical protein
MHHKRLMITLAAGLVLLGGAGVGLRAAAHSDARGVAQGAPGATSSQVAVGTAFTYQGRLTDDEGNPLTGAYDFEFRLYDGSGAGAGQVGQTVSVNDEHVGEGLFSVTLDFGADPFAGQARWLEVHVREGASNGGFTELLPRQAVAPAPYAIGLVPGATVKGALNNTGVLSLTNRAGDGLRVEDAADDGVQVTSANYGFYVQNAFADGLLINSAGNDGVHVGSALNDGVQVASAEYGIFVSSADTDCIFAHNADADGDGIGMAGFFDGNVRVTDHFTATNLYAVNKNFVIDHPLDPENKLLYHSSVESPERLNVYSGNVVLDGQGEAWVELPEYFEALNRDFRYQLTPIGGPAPNLYVAEEIKGNRFRLAGGEPGLKVSWQVTGIRDDASARANPMRVEVDKAPNKQGLYVDPESQGQPRSKGIHEAERADRWATE